jgi:spore germination protein GerM
MNRPIIIGIVLFFLVFGGLFYFIRTRPQPETSRTAKTAASPSQVPHDTRKINVKLFFATPGSAMLQAEERSIPYHDTLLAQAREVMNALLAGPQSNLISAIPDKTKLLDVMVSKDGIAYVDFSQEIVSNHQGGSTGEMITVYSIVNTLSTNLPQIHGVQILVEDHSVDTLNGHMDLSRPLKPDFSMARDQEEPQTKEQTQTS